LGYVNGEFTVNTIFKDVPNVDGLYGWGFTKIERYLCELAQEGYLSVRYASKQANLEYRYGKPKNIGSKTVAIYTVN
jgi:hypothetical protein